MKIKNLAFFGIMAAILGVNGAARADSTTIIASQAYVDAKDALKQDQNKRFEDTLSNYTETVAANQKKDYPSMYTLKQFADNIDVSGDISTAIGALDGNITGSTGVVKTISQTDGIVTATRDTVDTADITDGAVATAKLAADAVTNAKLADNAVQTENIKDGNVTMPKTNFIVVQGDSEAAWNTADPESENAYEKALATANTQGDKYVPTVAAVEKRIGAATSSSLDALDYTSSGTGVVKTVTQTNGRLDATVSTVDTAEITNSAVTADKLASDSVTTAKILNENVTTAKLAANAVTNAKLAADAVKTGNIENGTIKSEDVGEKETDNVVVSSNTGYLATVDGVQKGIMYQSDSQASWRTADAQGSHFDREASQEIQEKQKTAEKGMATQFTKPDMYVPTVAAVEKRVQQAESAAGGAINNLNLTADNQSGVIKTVTQTNGQVAVTSGTVGSAEIADGAVIADKLASDSVTTAKILDENVTTSKLAANAVTTAKIADANVTSGKLADNAVTTDKINAKAVTAGKIADDTITASQIASDAVDTAEIKNGAVTGAKIADGAVTNAKISANSLAYKDTMDPKLSNVNASNDAGTAMTNCTVGSPCTLTMIWDRTNSKPIYEWTNMDTEDTNAVL